MPWVKINENWEALGTLYYYIPLDVVFDVSAIIEYSINYGYLSKKPKEVQLRMLKESTICPRYLKENPKYNYIWEELLEIIKRQKQYHPI